MRHSITMKAKMVLVGDAGVGKTSLIRRFVLDIFSDEYINTLGTKVSKIELTVPHCDDVDVRVALSIFDIMGQPGFGELVKETFFHNCQCIMAVCDITRRATLESVHKWISTATEIAGDVPVVIMVNKKDLSSHAEIKEDDVEKAVKMHECASTFTSAKTGECVDDSFNALAIEVVEKAFSTYEARRVDENLKERLLAYLVRKGDFGASKLDIFQIFKGVGYDKIKRELEELDEEHLVRIDWRGPENFAVFATREGEQSLKAWRELPQVL